MRHLKRFESFTSIAADMYFSAIIKIRFDISKTLT